MSETYNCEPTLNDTQVLEFCKKFDVKRWDVQGGIEKKEEG